MPQQDFFVRRVPSRQEDLVSYPGDVAKKLTDRPRTIRTFAFTNRVTRFFEASFMKFEAVTDTEDEPHGCCRLSDVTIICSHSVSSGFPKMVTSP